MEESIQIIIGVDEIHEYARHYFTEHPRAKNMPIKKPYHESINTWMIMRRAAMNNLKQKWKGFIKWLVEEQGYANLRIEKCEISQKVFYPNNRRHDIDNSVPKFILDGLVEAGVVVDDDCLHITKLTLMCFIDTKNPRTELEIKIIE